MNIGWILIILIILIVVYCHGMRPRGLWQEPAWLRQIWIRYVQRKHRASPIAHPENLNEPAGVIMQDYRDKGLVVTEGDKEALHMFWSPRYVPPGLPNDMVRACIYIYWKLYPIRYTRDNFNTSIFNMVGIVFSQWKPYPPEIDTRPNEWSVKPRGTSPTVIDIPDATPLQS